MVAPTLLDWFPLNVRAISGFPALAIFAGFGGCTTPIACPARLALIDLPATTTAHQARGATIGRHSRQEQSSICCLSPALERQCAGLEVFGEAILDLCLGEYASRNISDEPVQVVVLGAEPSPHPSVVGLGHRIPTAMPEHVLREVDEFDPVACLTLPFLDCPLAARQLGGGVLRPGPLCQGKLVAELRLAATREGAAGFDVDVALPFGIPLPRLSRHYASSVCDWP